MDTSNGAIQGSSGNLSGFWKFIIFMLVVNAGILLGMALMPPPESPASAAATPVSFANAQPPSERSTPVVPEANLKPTAAEAEAQAKPVVAEAELKPADAAAFPDLPNLFSSVNVPAARGVKFTVRYPGDWKQVPPNGTRPCGKFLGTLKESASMLLFATPLPQGETIRSEGERQQILAEMVNGFKRKYQDVLHCPQTLAGRNGLAVSYYFSEMDNGKRLHLKVAQYVVLAGGNCIVVQCRAESLKNDAELKSRFERLLPVFDRIAQTLTIAP